MKTGYLPYPSALALIVAGMAPLQAQAEENSTADAAQLESVTVYGEGYRTTGTKSELEPIESPMSYEVYDEELLDQRQVSSVNQALRYVPGITPENRATVTVFDQYTMRGFQSFRNYYDGLPLQDNTLWNVVPQVDAFATQGIEVLKGPVSVLYGSAPPGGMINQTAKQPQSSPETLIRARAGSHSLKELAVDNTGAATDNVDYRVIALARQKDGQMQTTKEERTLLAPSATIALGNDTSLNVNLYYQDDPHMVPSTPLPSVGTMRTARYGELGSDAYAGDQNWGNMEREVTMIGYKLNHKFSPSLTFLQNFRHSDAEALQQNTYNYGLAAGDRTLIRSAYFTDEKSDGFAVDNQLAWKLKSGAAQHNVLVGVDYQTLELDIKYGDTLSINTPTIDLSNPNHNQINPAALPLDSYTETHLIDQSQLGIYLQDEIHWQAFTLIAGLRKDSYDSTDKADKSYLGSPWSEETRIDQDETSGRLAAMYTFNSGWAPYVSYAESYEPTSGSDTLTGDAFKPTTASQIETGVKFKSGDGDTEITAAIFEIAQENVVINTPDFMQYTQAGEVTSTGLELAIGTWFGDDLHIHATFNQQNVEVTQNDLDPTLVGKTPVWVADRQASLWGSYFINAAFDVSAGLRHVGKRQMDAANTYNIPGYTLADMAASYAINDQYRLGMTISNLADERYVGACYDANNCWMGAERSAEVSLYVNF